VSCAKLQIGRQQGLAADNEQLDPIDSWYDSSVGRLRLSVDGQRCSLQLKPETLGRAKITPPFVEGPLLS
jgi:hypothetical protein